MRSFRKPIRTKKVCHRLTAVFCVPLLALSPLITVGDTISVQRGATLDVSTETTETAKARHDAGLLDLAPERVAKIKEYLAAQKCPEPEIDAENYGAKAAVPSGPFYYGWTVDPLPQLKGFDLIGHMPDRDANDTKSTFFSAGLEWSYIPVDDIVPYLAAAGFKRARLNFAWRNMEKQKGVYDFSEADRLVDALIEAGIRPWFYGGYGNELYNGKIDVRGKFKPAFCDAPCYHGAEAVEGWNNFIRALAQHFKGRVELYEIWNELEFDWTKDGVAAHKTIGVTQAAKDFTAFFRRTSEIIKEVDPGARTCISLGPLTSGWACGLARAGLADALDMWTYHGYRRSPEEDVRMSLGQMRALFRRADGSLPDLAMGESGRGAGPAPTARVSTRTEYGQAKFVARRFFFDCSMGARFANIFNVGSKNYGLFKLEDHKPRLAYYVVRSLATIFDGLEPAPDLIITFKPRSFQSMESQTPWAATELHAFRRKGVPLFAWWQPEHLDIEGNTLYGRLVVQSGCDKKDNLKNPILIDPIRRTVWDVNGPVWSDTPGEDIISLVPATNYPYILTDISIFDEYVPSEQ